MAPISLKDNKIQFLTGELICKLTKFKKSSRNFTISSQYALSNFQYHKYLDVNSDAVTRLIEGMVQKFQVHSQYDKAETFQTLCSEFFNTNLCETASEIKTDTHYALMLLLLVLSNKPTNYDYVPLKQSSMTSAESNFNWKEYLLGDAEEEVVGIPTSTPCLEWSDDELDSLEPSLPSESEIDMSTGNDVILLDKNNKISLASKIEKGNLMISQHVVPQYWCDSPIYSNHSQCTSRFSPACSLAKTWQTISISEVLFQQFKTSKIMTETQVVKETIWMLSGVEKGYVYHLRDNYMHVNASIQVSHLTKNSLESLLVRFAKVGTQSIRLQKFKASILEEQSNITCPTSMTIQAFAYSLSRFFKDYKVKFLSKIETDIIKKESTVTLLHLYDRLSGKMKEIDTLYDVCKRGILEQADKPLPQRVTHLLDTIYISLREADALGESLQWKVSILLTSFLDTLYPCLEFIDSWVTSGNFHDPANEFFISRDASIPLQSTLFWEKGNSLRSYNKDSEAHLLVPCFLSKLGKQILLAGQSVNVIQGLGKMSTLSYLQDDGSLCKEFLHSVLSSSKWNGLDVYANPDTSFSDESGVHHTPGVRDLTIHVDDPLVKASLKSSVSASGLKYIQQRRETNDMNCKHQSDLQYCMTPIGVHLSQNLLPHLQSKCSKACSALISLLKSDFDLMEHLSAMKNIFLLEAGSTMHHFYLDIFKKIRQCQPWQDVSYLNSHLQEALYQFFPHYIDRLTISFSPSVAENTQFEVPGLHNMKMYYKVPWPANLIIDEFCLAKYNQVFIFLLTVKQVKWVLDSLQFTDLSGSLNAHLESDMEGQRAPRKSIHSVNQDLMQKMYILRFRLLHFVNSLHNYIMTRILHVTGLEFSEAFLKAENLNDAVAEHRAYVEKIFERCLLSDKVGIIKEAITKVFSLVFQFQNKWDRGIDELGEKVVTKIDAEFSKCNHFLITFLGNIIKRGSFPHLESLALSLSSSPA